MNGHSSEHRHRDRVELDSPIKIPNVSSTPSSPKSHRPHLKLSPSQLRYTLNSSSSGAPKNSTFPKGDTELRRQALNAARDGHHARAIALFSELIARNPASASDHNNRGLVYFQTAQLDQAIADYNKAIELNPNLDSVYNNRANYYACQGQLLAAILDYDIAIDLNPSNVRAWINQGITFRELQMHERAIECFDTALALGRLKGHIYAERGRTYHLWGDWNFAIADYARAIEALPFSTDTLLQSSGRLRLQVELWLDDLLSPLADAAD